LNKKLFYNISRGSISPSWSSILVELEFGDAKNGFAGPKSFLDFRETCPKTESKLDHISERQAPSPVHHPNLCHSHLSLERNPISFRGEVALTQATPPLLPFK